MRIAFLVRLFIHTIYYIKQIIPNSLFRNKRFMLDQMTWRNASKFAIFCMYENLKLLFPFFHFVLLYFFPNEWPGPGIHQGKK